MKTLIHIILFNIISVSVTANAPVDDIENQKLQALEIEKNLDYYLKAVEIGDKKAQINLAIYYYFAPEGKKDINKALKWFHSHAEEGDNEAQFILGIHYRNMKKYEKALKWFTEAATSGHAASQREVGTLYSKGFGIEQNYTKGLEWYTKAAEQGDAKAEFYIGLLTYQGLGTKKNVAHSIKWLQKAANKGMLDAQFILAGVYDKEEDFKKAAEWYLKVAERDEQLKIEKSQENTKKLYEGSQLIEGTLAERYVREHRKIKTAELPEDSRFILNYRDYDEGKAHPVLVSFSRDHEGRLTAHQLIYLDPITANKADIAVKKKSKGTIKGTTVEIQKGEGITYIAEGIETALSLKEVQINGRILVSLGLSNMNNISAHLKKDEPVIICADADNLTSSAWKTSERALEKLQQEGFKVAIIRPQGEKGRDFNDVLQEEGIKAVQEAFKNVAVFQADFYTQALEARPFEKQIVSPRDGRTTENNMQNKDIAKQDFNALDHYLACEEKLKKLPSFIVAKGAEKAQVKTLLQESRTHAYVIWEDPKLKVKAQELGIDKIIKQRAEFHKQEMNQSLNQKSSFKFRV